MDDSEITESDIQENFSLKIDGYPLLKKFRGEEEFTSWQFLEEMIFFSGLTFKCFIDGNKMISKIFPMFRDDGVLNEIEEEFISNLTLDEYLNNESYIKLERFINQQLNFSGVLDIFKDKRESYMEFIFISRSETPETSFHNDNNFFNILTYFRNRDTSFNPVIGSEILFVDQTDVVSHASMEDNGIYPEDPFLGNIPRIQDDILEMYKTKKIVSSILRGIYNSGDSLLLNDMLVKHSAANPFETIIARDKTSNFLKITAEIRTNSTNKIPSREMSVMVCNERKTTKPEYIQNRGIIGIFVTITPYQGVSPGDYMFNCPLTAIPPIPEINFTKDRRGELTNYVDFLHGIRHNGCFQMSETSKRTWRNPFKKSVTIKSRGGKSKHKPKRKSKRKFKRKSKSDFLFYQK